MNLFREMRKQLPLPEGIAPSRRPPPPAPVDDDTPPPPLPTRPRPTAHSSAPPVPSSSRPGAKIPAHKRAPVQDSESDDLDDDSFDSDCSKESYEDMSGQQPQEPPTLPSRGYQEPPRKLPPRPPAAKFKPPIPAQTEELYDEGDVGEVYAEAEGGASSGSETEEEQETYDAVEVGEAVNDQEDEVDQGPSENYDAFEGVGDEIEQNEYEVEEVEEQEEYQECEIGGAIQEDEYQVPDESIPRAPPSRGAPSLPPPRPGQRENVPHPPPPPPVATPAPPLPIPKQSREDRGAPPPPGPRDTPKKSPVMKGVGMPAIGMGDIQNIKNQLKKVSTPKNDTKPAEPKQYTDSNELKEKFNFFKQKEKEALARGNKPAIAPKTFNLKKSASVQEEDKPVSPELPSRPSDKLLPSHRKVNDSLPSVPSPEEDDLPPPPPPVSDLPTHRDLPPPPVSSTPNHGGHRELPPPPTSSTPDLPSRGKDGYTKVSVTEEEHNNHEDFEDDQEVYDEAISLIDPLLKESWYFGELDRAAGNEKLKKLNQNGAYLLRKSKQGGDKQPYTLMVIFKGHVYNLKIRERNDGRVAIGEEKADEMSFQSVKELIQHHQHNDVILVHRDGKQDTTLLVKCPPK